MLLRWAAVRHNFDLRSRHRRFDPRFDLLQRFHDEKAVIPREFEGSRNIARNFRHGIPRLRVAPLGMTTRESSFDYRWLKHIWISARLQVVLTKLRHWEFT